MSRRCQVFACEMPHRAKGYCNAHYKRARSGMDMEAPVRQPLSTEDRFWSKVDKSAPGDCWAWTGSTARGYAHFYIDGVKRYAYRLSYEWANGPIPEGAEVDHKCHNILCVNPDHLRLATKAQNAQNRKGATALSASGVRGVSLHKPSNRWRADARVGGKSVYLGMFDDIEEAEKAVVEWRRQNMPYSISDKKKEAA